MIPTAHKQNRGKVSPPTSTRFYPLLFVGVVGCQIVRGVKMLHRSNINHCRADFQNRPMESIMAVFAGIVIAFALTIIFL